MAHTRKAASAAVSRSKRRIARWLLLAWLATWLLGVLVPCCVDWNGSSDASLSQTAHVSHGQASGTQKDPGACEVLQPALATQDAAWSFAGTSPDAVLPPAASTVRLTVPSHARQRIAWTEVGYGPAVPIYLRTARLLI